MTMKTTASKLAVLCAMGALTACSSVTVTTDQDPSVSFSKYKTYTLARPAQGQTLSPGSEAALRDALRTQFATKGITEAPSGRGDLAIVRHVFLKDKVSVQQFVDWGYGYGGGMPYGYGRYGMWAGAPRTFTSVNQYTEGTMVLDFVDTSTSKLVFRSTGTAIVGKPEGNARSIQKAVEKTVAKFPAGVVQ